MYETAIPDDTRQKLAEMAPAGIVVGIPSYRNSRTVGTVVERVAEALDQHYAHLHPVIIHADGHSFDDTLSVASQVPLPHTVRRVATRYQGLPGKGSALRAIFEIASTLQAEAVLLIEADVTSMEPGWITALLEPVLQKELDLVLPLYQTVQPAMSSADLIMYPLISAMFGIPARYPTAGEIAMAGGVATFFAERDVWETDVARDGVDLWMTVEVALEEGRLGQVHLGPKIHRSHDSATLAEAKFLQEVGTAFRMAHLHESAWRGESAPGDGVSTFGTVVNEPVGESPLPDPVALWRTGKRSLKGNLEEQWQLIMTPQNLAAVEKLLQLPEEGAHFDDRLWAHLVYDFVVVYNQGEGDPDKVVTSLYPLFQLRHAALLMEASQQRMPAQATEELIQRQVTVFHEEMDYLLQRWENYVPPEQLELWRDLGILP